jgi:hypothetical protein
MTMSAIHPVEVASPMRGLLPLWVGTGVYTVFVLAGNHLLIDPDTLWQITVGQWIVDHGMVPQTDVYSFTMRGQPWISTQWLAQVAYAAVFSLAGWTGPVVLASACIAATFALFTRFLARHLSESTTLVFVAAALALTVPHMLARPHVLALPVMMAWVGGLAQAADRHGAPSFRLLPLMALWANLHGGFVLGLALVVPIALDAVLNADAPQRKALALRWAAFAVAAIAVSCATPYGWNSLLASRKILALGEALPLIMEWRPADFSDVGPLEVCLLLGFGLALYRGISLPPLRIVLLLGMLHMALSQMRSLETFALLAPLFLAAPLAKQIGAADERTKPAVSPPRGVLFAGIVVALLAGTVAYASVVRFEPHASRSGGGTEEAQFQPRVQCLRFRRLFDRQRRGAVHRWPHRIVRRKILRRSQCRQRLDETGESVPPARRIQHRGDAYADAERRDQIARSHRRLAEGLRRRHCDDPRPQAGCGAYGRAGGHSESELTFSVARMLRSAPHLRRGALLIRGRHKLRVCHGPGSAEQREERCTASGTRGNWPPVCSG